MLKAQLHRMPSSHDLRKYENFAKQKIVGWLPPPVGYEGLIKSVQNPASTATRQKRILHTSRIFQILINGGANKSEDGENF